MRCLPPDRARRFNAVAAAFTLVELLVVIGIIAILIAVLLPALNRARMSASSLACQANLKELGNAINIYAAQNKGYLPPGWCRITPVPPATENYVRWVDILTGIMSPKYGQSSSDAFASDAARSRLRQVFLCPDSPNQSTTSGIFTTYVSHPRLMPQVGQGTGSFQWLDFEPFYLNTSGTRKPKWAYQLGRVKRSSEIALIWEAPLTVDPVSGEFVLKDATPVANQIDKARYYSPGSPNLVDNWTTTSQPNDPVEIKTGFAGVTTNKDDLSNVNYQMARFRHLKDTVMNALMCDGHVEAFQYNKNKQTSTLLRKNIYTNLQQ